MLTTAIPLRSPTIVSVPMASLPTPQNTARRFPTSNAQSTVISVLPVAAPTVPVRQLADKIILAVLKTQQGSILLQ